ncbi:MAG: L-lysine dehydrogenase [Nitrospina sp.]|jgi:saccharopine dehydrogenase-like NADP-dependent oxidoreductase|nr:L-lysine dehydrogenase [Nitrospina sp.]MBT3510833.1 L-lysine dehydrogenase [Nitrospina sp.]MBT3875424.1 L-lysine dehydrogenase [Nitrospina sp.]MBT4047319.1 L-lysine dehydrogenase [Nitrospina sp.]MBT4557983.1 L-lysine dehydrogenase [Nitrospina sp.]
MGKSIQSVLVVGLGRVGSLAAILLDSNGYQVTGFDTSPDEEYPFKVISGSVEDDSVLKNAIAGHDAILTCLPYHLNLEVAKKVHQAGRHYFDLTEDVPTTTAIREMSGSSKGIMAPQCGLAPGFVGICGAHLAGELEQLRSIELRVGALPQHPRGLLGYAFNWSPEGVVNEYLNDCEVIQDGRRARVPAMEGLETIVIDGVQLEAFTTSGGLGTLCETYDGKVSHLNYKTIRYPGHGELMRFFFSELYMRDHRTEAGEILINAKPPVKEDVVYVHVAVEGWKEGKLVREEFVRSYFPREIHTKTWKAISWTTAASVSAVIELVSQGSLPNQGFLKQEDIPLDMFLNTPTGQFFK